MRADIVDLISKRAGIPKRRLQALSVDRTKQLYSLIVNFKKDWRDISKVYKFADVYYKGSFAKSIDQAWKSEVWERTFPENM